MKIRSTMRALVIVGWFAVVVSATPAWAIILGTFGAPRVTTASLANSNLTSMMRNSFYSHFPGSSIVASPTLTPAFLSGIDVLAIASDKTADGGITPLSASEQAALVDFVMNGGSAFLIAEGVPQFTEAAESMVNPFGITLAQDDLAGFLAALPTNPSHPIMSGPFGVQNYIAIYGGVVFPDLGPYATSLADLSATGQSAVAIIEPHVMGPHSGTVVIVGDSNPFLNGEYLGGFFPVTEPFFLNSLAYMAAAVPEPSSWVLAAMGAVALGVARGRAAGGRLLRSLRSTRRALVVVAGFTLYISASPAWAIILGTFGAPRVTDASIATGSMTSMLRNSLYSNFPGSTIVTSPTLTPAFLSGIDVLAIASDKTPYGGITPLSASEQSALVDYVLNGGSALLIAEGIPNFAAAAQSMISPFGLTMADDGLSGYTAALPVDPNHPIFSGPFGVQNYVEFLAGVVFPDLGPYATALANLPQTGQTAVAIIERHAMGPHSGAVVIVGDANFLENSEYFGGLFPVHEHFYLNTLAYLAAVPEPSTWALALVGLAALIGMRRAAGRRMS